MSHYVSAVKAVVGVGIVLLTFVAACALGLISAWNYPGGYALQALHASSGTGGYVHMDTETCMSGVTRFGTEVSCPQALNGAVWRYSKAEDLTSHSAPDDWYTRTSAVNSVRNSLLLTLKYIRGPRGCVVGRKGEEDRKHFTREEALKVCI